MTTYREFYEMAETTIRHQSHKFFKDGSSRRAALKALKTQNVGCGIEAIIDALADSLNNDSHVCYFDDPCDDWAA